MQKVVLKGRKGTEKKKKKICEVTLRDVILGQTQKADQGNRKRREVGGESTTWVGEV